MGIKNRPRPGISWSAMRKILEKDNICDSLKGRIQYFQTRYRRAHDQHGRIAIRLDGKEIVKVDYFDMYENMKCEMCDASFYGAFYEYQNNSIDKSIESSDPLVRLFAIMDKRLGRRRLEKLLPEVMKQPEWLQVFFKLRLEVEGVHSKGIEPNKHNGQSG